MKPITEERKQALIERLKKIASWAETYGPNHNVMLPASEAKEIAEIALASLKAEPAGWGLRSLQEIGRYGSWLATTPRQQSYLDYQPHKYENVLLYTAPPVPVIKLPVISELINAGGAMPAVRDVQVWELALSEIKRLNDLE